MEELIGKYYDMVTELQKVGEYIIRKYEGGDDRFDDAVDEIDNMNMHCDCSLKYLEEVMQRNFPKFGK